jgi:hypothetical protein
MTICANMLSVSAQRPQNVGTSVFWKWQQYQLAILRGRAYLLTPWNTVASWEANRFATSQEIPRTLWKVHYRIRKCLPTVLTLSQLDTVHTTIFHFLKIHLNIIFPSTTGSPHWSLSSGFPTKNLYAPFPSPSRSTCPAHLILLD